MPLRDPIFFIDKCLGLKVVPAALRACGLTVELKTDHFPQETPDSQWLTEVGKRGWIVLSKDQNLKHNHLEIVALLKSNTHSFILMSAQLTGDEMAQAFITAMPQIKNIIAKQPPPLVATVTKEGEVRITHTYDELTKSLPSTEVKKKK